MKRFICGIICIFVIFTQSVFAAGGYNPVLKRLRAVDSNSTLILMYHKLSEKSSENGDFCIKPQEFEADIKLLCESGYTFLTASELAAAKKEKGDRKIAVITFDDGYESDYIYAVPILEKYGAKATFFVFGGAIGKKEYMTREQVKFLADSKCAEIGNHSFEFHSKSVAEVKMLYMSKKTRNI